MALSQQQETEEDIDQFAQQINQLGWLEPFMVIFDLLQPAALLVSQVVWLLQPTLGLLFSREKVGRVARILEDRQLLRQLQIRLEEERNE